MKSFVLALVVAVGVLGLVLPVDAYVRMRSYDDCMRDRSETYNAHYQTEKGKELIMNECKKDGELYDNYYEEYCKKTFKVSLDAFRYSVEEPLISWHHAIWDVARYKSDFGWKSVGNEEPKCWITLEMSATIKKHHLDDGTPFNKKITAYARRFVVHRGLIYIDRAYIASVE